MSNQRMTGTGNQRTRLPSVLVIGNASVSTVSFKSHIIESLDTFELNQAIVVVHSDSAYASVIQQCGDCLDFNTGDTFASDYDDSRNTKITDSRIRVELHPYLPRNPEYAIPLVDHLVIIEKDTSSGPLAEVTEFNHWLTNATRFLGDDCVRTVVLSPK